jgi:hypothetical protein
VTMAVGVPTFLLEICMHGLFTGLESGMWLWTAAMVPVPRMWAYTV